MGPVVDPAAFFSAGPVADDGTWLRVDHQDAVGAVRRAAAGLAHKLNLPAQRIAELEIVASELAANVYKHAHGGAILIRSLRFDDRAAVELIAVDSGPGMSDVLVSATDGHSTAGTLGIGLGAIARQSTWWETYSLPEHGTVVAAQIWSSPPAPPAWAQGVERPMTGESMCGDAYAFRASGQRGQVMLCDGLGHGPMAALAARAATEAFLNAPVLGPGDLLRALHGAMSHTRGAAVLIAELNPETGTVRCAGLGNVSGTITGYDRTRAIVSLPGIVGHQRPAIREFDYPMAADSLLVLHSDGVSAARWKLTDLPGLALCSPVVMAATILREAGVRRDDASVLVARLP